MTAAAHETNERHAPPAAGPAREPAPGADLGGRRWLMLALGTAAQTAAFAFVYGVPYLVPALRAREGLDLAQSGLVVACPTAGLLVTLVAWGAAADRWGERVVLASGLGLSTLAMFGAAAVHGPVLLGLMCALAGAAGASVSAAGGRVVLGWFAARERGLAMGVRQTATPLGMAIAALSVPPLAGRYGLGGALLLLAALNGVVTVLVALLVVDPPRPAPKPRADRAGGQAEEPRPVSPYRSAALWRIHAASALMVWPQFTMGAFGLVFLTDVRHWDAGSAGRLMAAGQVVGALSRVLVGRWSDRAGSRLGPMRKLAVVVAVLSGALALCAVWPSWAAEVVLVAVCGLAASTNGLSFTSVAELAGPRWAGRALGVQNTGQNLTASLTPPLVGALITATGYAPAFALAALLALAAVPVTPRR